MPSPEDRNDVEKLSEHHSYTNGYIEYSDIELEGTPDTISVEEQILFKKSEFHISLICAKRVAEIIDPERHDAVQAEIAGHFKRYIAEVNPLDSFTLTGELRFVEVDERKTIVALADFPGLKEFFERLEATYKVNLPLQPAHITMYTLQPNTGIGILSFDELDAQSKRVEVAELEGLKVVE